MRLTLLLVLLLLPTASWAQEAGESTEEAPADEAPADEAPAGEAPAVDDEAAKLLKALTTDSLGRPYPNPEILKITRRWRTGGYVMTGTGAAMLVGGLTAGSALARNSDPDQIGETLNSDNPFANAPPPGAILVGGLFGGGGVLLLTGVPLLSSGEFATKQLLRTIKGAEKVPRTIANELDYWRAYMDLQYGQGTSIGGGFTVAFGVLSMVAVGALVGTDRYKPEFWTIPVGLFAGGGAMLGVGLATTKKAKDSMEAIRDEKDPLRQAPTLSLRIQGSSPTLWVDGERTVIGWSFSATF